MIVSPDTVIDKIKPGYSIFLGTAAAEPRTIVQYLMTSGRKLEDLELIQLVSLEFPARLLRKLFSLWMKTIKDTESRLFFIK